MATDITTQLIKMIEGGSASALGSNRSALGSSADLLSVAANYAQLFGTAAPPALAWFEAATSDAATTASSAAAEATTLELSSTATLSIAGGSAGVGAIAVLLVTALATILTMAGRPDQSDQAKAYQELTDAINTLTDAVLAGYWQDKLENSPAAQLWIPLKGDLDHLARQGTGGNFVKNDLSHSQTDGMNFVNELTNSLEVSAGFGIGQYWQVPAQPAGDVPQADNPSEPLWQWESWYGNFPARLHIANSPSGNVLDPRTMLPVLALGLQSYITLQSVANLVDSTQPTLPQFLNQFWPDFGDPNSRTSYINFLFQMYKFAVNGIVKTDLPSEEEVLGFLWEVGQNEGVYAHASTRPTLPTQASWGADWPVSVLATSASSGNGWAWNGTYGASETYPQYGFYGNYQGKNTRNLFTQAYIVSQPDTTNAGSQWQQSSIIFSSAGEQYASIEAFENWTIPWLQNRIILGSMARWKAIYLLNGFDRVWSVLQALQQLAPLGRLPSFRGRCCSRTT